MGFTVQLRLIHPLDELPIRPDKRSVMKTASGLEYYETEAGTGAQAVAGKTVKVHYTGRFPDGKVFDSSVSRGEPIEFVLD
jgi:FKBP-type peptidyl-prolyl cis-trans isomerase